MSGVKEYASCSVNRTLEPANANQMYSFDTIRLADYQRASGIGEYYQRFRIKGVTLTFKPVFDTYSAVGAGPGVALQKPNLYYIIDKSGALPDNITLESLKQAGAVSKVIDEKPFYISWRPSVLNEVQATIGGGASFAGPAGYKISPWLTTNQNATNAGAWQPNSTNHLGIKFYIEQVGNGGSQIAYDIPMDIKVEFEFSKAVIGLLTSAVPKSLQYKELNDSPDGVVGGADGV